MQVDISKYQMGLASKIIAHQIPSVLGRNVYTIIKSRNVIFQYILDSKYLIKEYYNLTVKDTLNSTFILESSVATDL